VLCFPYFADVSIVSKLCDISRVRVSGTTWICGLAFEGFLNAMCLCSPTTARLCKYIQWKERECWVKYMELGKPVLKRERFVAHWTSPQAHSSLKLKKPRSPSGRQVFNPDIAHGFQNPIPRKLRYTQSQKQPWSYLGYSKIEHAIELNCIVFVNFL